MEKTIKIENKIINIYYKETIKNNLPVVIINIFNENGKEIWDITSEKADYILVTISNIKWNKEMSPWKIDNQFGETFEGNADIYLKELTNIIVPILKRTINKEISYFILGGYSLAGLFAIYSMYKTELFNSYFSVSGSLWYPNFLEFVKENKLLSKPDKIYFSLGNKESKTRNKLMSKVQMNTKFIEEFYKNKGIKTIYEENEGNHFMNVTERIAKAIIWILNK